MTDFLKNAALFVFATSMLLAACSKQEQPPATPATPAPVATPAPQARRVATPERIAEIEASGKKGLWSTVTEVCRKDVKSGLRTTLVWNVKDSGARRVVVYVVDPAGKENHFGQGGAVGELLTGPWLFPGRTFKLRNYDTRANVGTVVIGEKSC